MTKTSLTLEPTDSSHTYQQLFLSIIREASTEIWWDQFGLQDPRRVLSSLFKADRNLFSHQTILTALNNGTTPVGMIGIVPGSSFRSYQRRTGILILKHSGWQVLKVVRRLVSSPNAAFLNLKPDEAYVTFAAFLPEFRKQSFSPIILHYLLEYCVTNKREWKQLRFDVAGKNHRALSVFRSLGAEVAETMYQGRDKILYYHMILELERVFLPI